MKVTIDNIKEVKYIEGYNKDYGVDALYNTIDGQNLLKSLLIDLDELNDLLKDKGESYRQIYINYEDKHTEYSPERVDPCPDYYGMFTLRFEKNPYETVGDIMTLNELDSAICILINFTEFKLS